MQELTQDQKDACFSIMKKLQEKSISTMFAFPVNPERDNCPNYNEIVAHPMDLSTVNEKLKNNQYHTISEWKKDVELIWSNSLLYHKTNQILRTITQEMHDTFVNLSKFITDDPRQDWNNKLIYLRDKFFLETKAFENYTKESRLSLKNHGQFVQPHESQRGRKKRKTLNRSGIIRLAKELNRLEKDEDLIAILNVIEEEEPNVKVEGEYLELNLTDLKATTLVLLRNKLDSILPKQQTPTTDNSAPTAQGPKAATEVENPNPVQVSA